MHVVMIVVMMSRQSLSTRDRRAGLGLSTIGKEESLVSFWGKTLGELGEQRHGDRTGNVAGGLGLRIEVDVEPFDSQS